MVLDRWAVAIGVVAGLIGSLALGAAEPEKNGNADVRIKIADLAYVPEEVTVRRGGAVEIVNNDFVDHTATANAGDWDVQIAAGSSARVSLDTEGTFTYYCRYHPGMKGTVRVVGN